MLMTLLDLLMHGFCSENDWFVSRFSRLVKVMGDFQTEDIKEEPRLICKLRCLVPLCASLQNSGSQPS